MTSVVSDLVIETVNAASESLASHFWKLLRVSGPGNPKEKLIAEALDHGYDADLDEETGSRQPVKFDHTGISKIFRRRLTKLPARRLSPHIGEADEDRNIYSLFGNDRVPRAKLRRGQAKSESEIEVQPLRTRTRASAIVQKSLRHCRRMRHAEKATIGERTQHVTIPSPLYVARQLLSDPHSAASQICVVAALQELIREKIEESAVGKIDLSFAALSYALTTINNRWKTSRPIKTDEIRRNRSTVLFLCNFFAMQGYMAMRMDLGEFDRISAELSQMWAGSSKTLEKAVPQDEKKVAIFDARFWSLLTGSVKQEVEFIVDPQFSTLPDAGLVLNMIEGLPLPMEGALTVFQGGLRLSEGKSCVAAISGPFGAGKTLLCLSLAAALAPLGCRTLFLSSEERREDIQARLAEAAPTEVFRSAFLFRALQDIDFSVNQFLPELTADGSTGDLRTTWFKARTLKLEYPANERTDDERGGEGKLVVDPASALSAMLKDAIEHADFFKAPMEDEAPLPRFARPVVIIDGLHQLFDFTESQITIVEPSLRELVESCRTLGAVFIFSFSTDAPELKRLEYLCDLIVELDRGGYQSPDEKPNRLFRLLKARRQPARTGAHIFHLTSNEGFRIKPSLDARVYESKSQLWWEPDSREEIFLTDETPPGFSREPRQSNRLPIRNHGQILVIGRGSAGKAGFGLYLLHRRWFDRHMFSHMFPSENQLTLAVDDHVVQLPDWSSKRKEVIAASKLPVRYSAEYLETRVLVISFLYQASYYKELTTRLSLRQKGKAEKERFYGPLRDLKEFAFTPLPDRLHTDTIELYPGRLGVEDFLAKVDRKLTAAEFNGTPYTGVLIDGLHNVFVQYPALEQKSEFWGIFYNLLRRRRVTVVTTHTEFDLKSSTQSGSKGSRDPSDHPLLIYDFEQAQRKIAPLLAAMVSGADYLFNLSSVEDGGQATLRLMPISALGVDVSGLAYRWDRDHLSLAASAQT